MPSVPINETASVVLDGSGNGTAKVGPRGMGTVWHPEVVSVKTSTAVKSATCKVYAGWAATDDNFVDGTYTGGQNATDNIRGQLVYPGNYVFAVWSGGDVGATATVTVTGTKDLP